MGEIAIDIDRVERRKVIVPIVGLTPLISHQWSEKAKRQMLEAQQGIKKVKEHRDPQAEFESARYRLPDGTDAFPAIGFKSSIVGGARFYGKDVPMTMVRRAVFVAGFGPKALIAIEAPEPWCREDMVRVGQGGTDLRYRPQYDEWKATIECTYTPTMINVKSLLALIDAGGQGDGLGEMRPEKGGTYGTYTIDVEQDIAEVVE